MTQRRRKRRKQSSAGEQKKTVVSTAAAMTAVAGNAAIIGGATAIGAFSAALIAAVGPTVGLLWQTTTNWHARQTELWWDTVSAKLGPAVRAEVEERIMHERVTGKEPVAGKVVSASVRVLLEGANDALVPILGALAAEYLRESKPADDFFRAMARTLADLDESGLRDLRVVVEKSAGFAPPGVELEPVHGEKDQFIVTQAAEENADREANAQRTAPFALESGPRLISLLKRHGLGWETPTRMDQVNPFRCFFACEELERVRRLLDH